ncbi:SNF2 domain-containing protein CLASSY 1-like [Euphorbia lathyris]|uniref:SNF2 domain-containing protein CLASSY 1-like n=1 Tax=Euphorbia lathyris TaxID=212925 RepID=UPI0033144B9C
MKRKRLDISKHSFETHPFEVLERGTWRSVEHIEIRDGIVSIHFPDNRRVIEDKGPISNMRVKSRQAEESDCTLFLRPTVDICVLSSSKEDSEVWSDAKINSIERKPHESQCKCRFFIKRYVDQGPLGSEKMKLDKEIEEVGIDRIRILQRLPKCPSEGQFSRWDFSEDCPSLKITKLLLGKFSADLTFLLVASVLKQIAFDVRSVQNKVVYEILACDEDRFSIKSNNHLNSLNFKVDNDIVTSVVHQFAPEADEPQPACDTHETDTNEALALSVPNVRRSKRRNVQPERFLGCDLPPDANVDWVRQLPIRPEKPKEDELFLPLSYVFGPIVNYSAEQTEEEMRVCSSGLIPIEDIPISHFKTKSRKRKPCIVKQKEHQNELAIVPVPSGNDPVDAEQVDSPVKTSGTSQEKNNFSFNFYRKKASPVVQKKQNFELEELMLKSKWKGKPLISNAQSGRYRSRHHKRTSYGEPVTHKRTSLTADAYNRLIRSYVKNIDSTTISKEEPHIVDHWEQFKAKNRFKSEDTEPIPNEDEEEMSETEMLWREMEYALASAYLLEENEVRVSRETMEESVQHCRHVFKLDEEIGILCRICGFVSTEMKYVTAPFMENAGWTAENKSFKNKDYEFKPDEEDGLNILRNYASNEEMSSSEAKENVWALIPDLRTKLHEHQKRAFEFLWKNVAGSLIPANIEKASRKVGGCVVSHTPGAGKTFLIIAFLVSYLKLFPGKRPMVLAPKTTLYTWHKEFIKWNIPIPVHLIHGRRTYRVFRQKGMKFQGSPFQGGLNPGLDVMHVLDCLEKIQKWHAQPSVLVMGYTSFLTLMREDSKFAHRRFMAKVLRESPGLLVLDEGHNPRSTKSRLRKVLMKVQTDLRILLSGTLFQNNFCEYFNTLCLARPKFIKEVLKSLDPKFKRKRETQEKARHLLESRARKFFLDNIARKIDSKETDERMEGLNMLRNMTSRFIDVYEGGASDGLPGLQIYTILMNSTDIQHETLIKLRDIMATYNGYPLELELLITLASIHPWLVKTSNCVNKFFDWEELAKLEKLKNDFKKGSKVMFVLNLIFRVVQKEKVLIFCHNIAPINMFIELFESVFQWQRGREIMSLTGDLELFERGRVMDKFEEPGSPCRVLLASITACAEGISLTAASRVIMLDSEWNPSKTKQAIARAFRPGQQKVVYVYQLLATGTLEEDKYRRTTWKEWVSSMIFSEAFVEDPSRWQAEKIEDDVLREMVGEDKVKSFHMIMKNEKASTG